MPRPWVWLAQPTRDDATVLVNANGLIPDGCNPRDRPVSREKSFQARPWKTKVNNDAPKTCNDAKIDVDRGYHQLFNEQGPTSFFDFGRRRTETKTATQICATSPTAPTDTIAIAHAVRTPAQRTTDTRHAPSPAAYDNAPYSPPAEGVSFGPPVAAYDARPQATTPHALLNAKWMTSTRVSTAVHHSTSIQSSARVLTNREGVRASLTANTYSAPGARQPEDGPPALPLDHRSGDQQYSHLAAALKKEPAENIKERSNGANSISRDGRTTKCNGDTANNVAEPAVVNSSAAVVDERPCAGRPSTTLLHSGDDVLARLSKSVDTPSRVLVNLPHSRHAAHSVQCVGEHTPSHGPADGEVPVPHLRNPPATQQKHHTQLAANSAMSRSPFYSGWKLRQAQLFAYRTFASNAGGQPCAEKKNVAVDDVSVVDAVISSAPMGNISRESQATCTSTPSGGVTVASRAGAPFAGGESDHDAGSRVGSPSEQPTHSLPSEQENDDYEPGLGKVIADDCTVGDGELALTENGEDEDEVMIAAEERKPDGVVGIAVEGESAPTGASVMVGAFLRNIPSIRECAKDVEIKQEKPPDVAAEGEAERTTTKPGDRHAVPPTVARPAWQHVVETKTTHRGATNIEECGAIHGPTAPTNASSTPKKNIRTTPDYITTPTKIQLPAWRPITSNQPTPSARSSVTPFPAPHPPPTTAGCSPIAARHHIVNAEHTPPDRPCTIIPNAPPPRTQIAPPAMRPATAGNHLPQFITTQRPRIDQTPPPTRPTTCLNSHRTPPPTRPSTCLNSHRTPPPTPPTTYAVSNRTPFSTRPTTVGSQGRTHTLTRPTTTGAPCRTRTPMFPTTAVATDRLSRIPLSARQSEHTSAMVTPRLSLSARGNAHMVWGDSGRQIDVRQGVEQWRNIAEAQLECRPKTAPYQVFDSHNTKTNVEKNNRPASRNYIPKAKNNHATISR